MKRAGESQFEYIIRKTGRKPVECRCKLCQAQCRATSCLGTPQDILKIVKAGYADRIVVSEWAAGIIMGVTKKTIYMFQPRFTEEEGCTFFHDGLCELHDKGLKPTEGRLSHHTQRIDNFVKSKSISWNVAQEWMEPRNRKVVQEIAEILKQRNNPNDNVNVNSVSG